ncbi:hypothetical protein FIBSPDRAFT_737741, partial [Athelia psychrophila]
FGGEASLPYISTIINECLRWAAVTPIAIPPQLAKDDEYPGYHLPARTALIPTSG